jgi:hypothetical protein
MGIINPTLPSVNSPRGDEEVDARNALATVLGEFNGNVDQNNLKDGAVTKAKLATDALNAFLKLVVAADIKVAFGNYVDWGLGRHQCSDRRDCTRDGDNADRRVLVATFGRRRRHLGHECARSSASTQTNINYQARVALGGT